MFEKCKRLVKAHWDVVTYLIFGVLTTVVNYAVYLPCLNILGLSAAVSNCIAWVVAVAFAFLGFWLLGRIGYTNIVRQLYLVLIILLSTFSVITFRWKISMHMTAIGGLCGFLLVWGMNYQGDVRNAFILFLLLSGILATSRLYLKKHTPLQVYLGFLFGLFFVFGILL